MKHQKQTVKFSGPLFVTLIILAIIGFLIVSKWGIDIVVYIISEYGWYLLAGYFGIMLVVLIYENIGLVKGRAAYNIINEMPYVSTLGLAFLILLPLFAKGGYPTITTFGGLIYYFLIIMCGILLLSVFVSWIERKFRK